MLDGPSVARALKECGVTHVVWVPDSEIGRWEEELRDDPELTLVRVCREGEALGVAAGLWLGGRHPVVMIQCTGFFEAGDAFRNVVHDLKLPLFVLVGVRSYYAHQQGATADTCPAFTGPVVGAWGVPSVVFERERTAADLAAEIRKGRAEGRARVVLLAE